MKEKPGNASDEKNTVEKETRRYDKPEGDGDRSPRGDEKEEIRRGKVEEITGKQGANMYLFLSKPKTMTVLRCYYIF